MINVYLLTDLTFFIMKKIFIVLLFVVLACGTFFMAFEKNAKAQLCGFDDRNVCCKSGSSCYCLDPE